MTTLHQIQTAPIAEAIALVVADIDSPALAVMVLALVNRLMGDGMRKDDELCGNCQHSRQWHDYPVAEPNGTGCQHCVECHKFVSDTRLADLLTAAQTIIRQHTPELSGKAGFAELIAAVAKAGGE